MTTQTITLSGSGTNLAAAVFAILLGLSIVAVTGLAQAESLHSAAHDVRHTNGFPCH